MAFDPVANRLLVLWWNTFPRGWEMWSWNHVAWSLVSASGIPDNSTLFFEEPAARPMLVSEVVETTGRHYETRAWTGSEWLLQTVSAASANVTISNACYDKARRRLVVCRLASASAVEVWECDGTAWQTSVGNAGAPSLQLVYAEHRRRVQSVSECAIREWDGTSWTTLHERPRPDIGSLNWEYHPRTDALVGLSVPVPDHETWTYDAAGWRLRSMPVPPPPPRVRSALWHDDQDVWLFGGQLFRQSGNGPAVNETMQWDGNLWTSVPTMHAPSPRVGMAIAWDSGRRRAVLFGGNDGTTTFGDTWEFDGSDWLLRAASAAPLPRHSAAIAYDPGRALTIMCLGTRPDGFRHTDSWAWDGQQWLTIPWVHTYAMGGGGQAMGYDPELATVELFVTQINYVASHRFTGSAWVLGPPLPRGVGSITPFPGRRGAMNAVHSSHSGIYVRRRTNTPSSVQVFGLGCARPPFLRSLGAPDLGSSAFTVEVTTEPNQLVLYLAAGTTMSLALGNGCSQLVPHDHLHFFRLTDPLGIAQLAAPIPNDMALRGLVLNFQVFALQPAAAGGFAASAGLRATVGP